MTLIDEVLLFAHDYINNRHNRSPEKKAKIRRALKELTGENIGISCGTCYIEALLKIIKLRQMATSNYELKRGYVAQFDIPYKDVKSFTDLQLTDDLAEEYLRRYPERVVYFARLPEAVKIIPPSINIISPKKDEKEPLPETNEGLIGDTLKSILEPESKAVEPAKRKSTSKRKSSKVKP